MIIRVIFVFLLYVYIYTHIHIMLCIIHCTMCSILLCGKRMPKNFYINCILFYTFFYCIIYAIIMSKIVSDLRNEF